MGHPHTTSNEDGKASERFAFQVSNHANILRVDVDAVIARICNAYFEFAWEIGWAIDGLNVLWSLNGVYLFPINPDFMICSASGSKVRGDLVRNLFYLCFSLLTPCSWPGHNIPVHVAPGC